MARRWTGTRRAGDRLSADRGHRNRHPSSEGGRAMTKAQEVYDRVEALVASGVKKADAFRQLSDEYGQEFNSIRGAYYAHTRSLGGSPRQPGNGQTAVDPIESAT